MRAALVLVCHAPTSAVRSAAFPADEPIDERGQANAVTLAPSLPRARQAWCGPSIAARQTAAALGLVVGIEPDLRDCDFGRWAGRRVSDVALDEPEAFSQWMSDASAAPHGGEALVDVIRRVSPWLDRCRATAGTTIAVTHASVIRAAVVSAIDTTPNSFWHLDIGPLSRTSLRTDGRRWKLRGLTESTSLVL